MPEENDKNIRVPVPGEEGKHTDHKIRTIIVSEEKGIKALYCITCKKIITYIFAKNKDWDMAKAKEWVSEHTKKNKRLEEIHVDQQEEFLKIVATFEEDAHTEEYLPNSESFILEKSIEAFTTGLEPEPEEMELLKLDKQKHIVYGIFLVPEKADHDGDVISEEDIEKVAHDFLVEYRTIDEMHKNIIAAQIVESAIAWEGMEFYGRKLKKGTWFGAIKINDNDVWDKVLSGEYKAFSVRIAGMREPIEEGS